MLSMTRDASRFSPSNGSLPSYLEKSLGEIYRVANTNISLRMAFSTETIQRANLGRTILQSQREVQRFIDTNQASDWLLDHLHDPFESGPLWRGCFIGVKMSPPGHNHFTCGMLMDVLQGLWIILYRKNRHHAIIFDVRDDTYGIVAVGKVSPRRIPGSTFFLGGENFTGTKK